MFDRAVNMSVAQMPLVPMCYIPMFLFFFTDVNFTEVASFWTSYESIVKSQIHPLRHTALFQRLEDVL